VSSEMKEKREIASLLEKTQLRGCLPRLREHVLVCCNSATRLSAQTSRTCIGLLLFIADAVVVLRWDDLIKL